MHVVNIKVYTSNLANVSCRSRHGSDPLLTRALTPCRHLLVIIGPGSDGLTASKYYPSLPVQVQVPGPVLILAESGDILSDTRALPSPESPVTVILSSPEIDIIMRFVTRSPGHSYTWPAGLSGHWSLSSSSVVWQSCDNVKKTVLQKLTCRWPVSVFIGI